MGHFWLFLHSTSAGLEVLCFPCVCGGNGGSCLQSSKSPGCSVTSSVKILGCFELYYELYYENLSCILNVPAQLCGSPWKNVCYPLYDWIELGQRISTTGVSQACFFFFFFGTLLFEWQWFQVLHFYLVGLLLTIVKLALDEGFMWKFHLPVFCFISLLCSYIQHCESMYCN